jgi:hypothetical protein
MVSKPTERNKRCRKMEQRHVEPGISFVSDAQPAKTCQPGEGAFDDPAVPITPQEPTIFIRPIHAHRAIRADERDPARRQPAAQSIAVVPALRTQSLRFAAGRPAAGPGHRDGVQRRIDERRLAGSGRGDANSQRYTRAVDHHHALRALAAARVADGRAPFFAGTKVASMNACSHGNRPRASRWLRNARHSRIQIPSASQSRSRRQQVLPLGYPSGRSRHRAPVRSTHRIPSTTSRCPTRGRPPVGDRGLRGRCGAIFAHCASVSRTLRLATSTSGQRSTAASRQVQVLFTSSPGF